MNQTWENSTKKLVLGPILAHLAQIWTTVPPPQEKGGLQNKTTIISKKYRKNGAS